MSKVSKPTNLSIAKAINEGAERLRENDVPAPRQQAAWLLENVIGRDRSFLFAHADDSLSEADGTSFLSLIARRAAGEPLQYLIRHQEFFKLDFEVTPAVLIPRPETELVIESALELLRDDPDPYLADIGTGSGCIAISILHEIGRARGMGTDVSMGALEVAQRNAVRHGVDDRLRLLESNFFSGLEADGSFSLMVSNPPYIPDDELEHLQREVKHEPRSALAGGAEGLTIIRRLLSEARPFLRPGGHFVFEIGCGQSEAVEQLIDHRVWKLVEIRRDLQQIARTFILQALPLP